MTWSGRVRATDPQALLEGAARFLRRTPRSRADGRDVVLTGLLAGPGAVHEVCARADVRCDGRSAGLPEQPSHQPLRGAADEDQGLPWSSSRSERVRAHRAQAAENRHGLLKINSARISLWVLKVQYDGSTDLERLEDEHYPQATEIRSL